jgi:hypothetical protein
MATTINVDLDCKGPNQHCRKASRQGLSVHVAVFNDVQEIAVVMPTHHYETEEQGRAAISDAFANAQMIETDEDLFTARRLRQPYKLPVGWVDPSSR